jgi:TolA-binding protein
MDRRVLASVPRLLIKRTYLYALLLLALTFPAAGFAASGGSRSAAPSVSDAAIATVSALRQPAVHFRQVVHDVARRIRVERRAERRRELREQRERFADLPGGVSIETLAAIASCESGGDPTAVSSDGSYRGKYQFDYGTWESVGGQGDPAAAPELEQDYRAALLYSRSGSSPWPVCG